MFLAFYLPFVMVVKDMDTALYRISRITRLFQLFSTIFSGLYLPLQMLTNNSFCDWLFGFCTYVQSLKDVNVTKEGVQNSVKSAFEKAKKILNRRKSKEDEEEKLEVISDEDTELDELDEMSDEDHERPIETRITALELSKIDRSMSQIGFFMVFILFSVVLFGLWLLIRKSVNSKSKSPLKLEVNIEGNYITIPLDAKHVKKLAKMGDVRIKDLRLNPEVRLEDHILRKTKVVNSTYWSRFKDYVGKLSSYVILETDGTERDADGNWKTKKDTDIVHIPSKVKHSDDSKISSGSTKYKSNNVGQALVRADKLTQDQFIDKFLDDAEIVGAPIKKVFQYQESKNVVNSYFQGLKSPEQMTSMEISHLNLWRKYFGSAFMEMYTVAYPKITDDQFREIRSLLRNDKYFDLAGQLGVSKLHIDFSTQPTETYRDYLKQSGRSKEEAIIPKVEIRYLDLMFPASGGVLIPSANGNIIQFDEQLITPNFRPITSLDDSSTPLINKNQNLKGFGNVTLMSNEEVLKYQTIINEDWKKRVDKQSKPDVKSSETTFRDEVPVSMFCRKLNNTIPFCRMFGTKKECISCHGVPKYASMTKKNMCKIQ
jgi:hypothetical protein